MQHIVTAYNLKYWGTKAWNIDINFVFFKKNKKINLKTHV